MKIISDCLIELSKLCQNEGNLTPLENIYGITIKGKKNDEIYLSDLVILLKNIKGIEISEDELLKILPDVCKSIGLRIKAQHNIRGFIGLDPFDAPISGYAIYLL